MIDLSWIDVLRNDFLTVFFKIISYTAEELFLIVFLSIGYWCMDKKFYRDLAIMVCISILSNMLLKDIFQVARPLGEHLMYVNDHYSFPSGHAQEATIFWLLVGLHYRKPLVWWLAVAMIVGQCLSRIYLNVHFPSDVLGGVIVGAITVFIYALYKDSLFWRTMSRSKGLVVLLFAIVLGMYYFYMGDAIHTNNVLAGGALMGIVLGYLLEEKFCHFEPPKNYFHRMIIITLGLLSLGVLKWVLKFIMPDKQSLTYVFTAYFLLTMSIIYFVPALGKKFVGRGATASLVE